MFDRERHPVDVTHRGTAYRFYARELGYLHLQEIFSKPHEGGGETVKRLNEVLLASIEQEDGTLVFPTLQALRDAPKAVYEACLEGVMKAQALTAKSDGPVAESEGNVKRSKTSGMN
jgi:hypothetical protein